MQEEVRRRIELLLHHDSPKVERYLSLYGYTLNMKGIQEVREGTVPDEASPAPVDKNAGLEIPVYNVDLTCPCCREKNVLHRELRASAMAVKNDAFMVPVYSPIGKFQKLNYLTVAVAVCPKCFFASPDKKDFIQFNRTTKQSTPSQLSPSIISQLQDTMAERQEMVEKAKVGKDFASYPRSLEMGILTYQLALQRASVEAYNKNPFAIYKRASYLTRIALLQKQSKQDELPTLEKALTLFQEAFYRTDFPNANLEFQSCFVIFSILLRFGKEKEARDYLSVMEQGKKEVEERNDPTAVQALNTWLGMAKARWDDRKDPDLWNIPS